MSALEGVRVLDVGHLTSGPLTSWLLGSLGAEVIKVEPPSGDGGRTNLSPSEDAGDEGGYYFHSTNTDKRSIVVNMKTQRGRDVLFDLVKEADVLVENFRPGTMTDLGVGYETLREHNPGLIYCSITGFGQDNESGEVRAYDSILQALAGMMMATGYRDDPPTKIGVSVIDNLGSYVASVAVLGALNYHRETGTGQYIDISMQDCATWIVQSLVPFDTERTRHQPATAPFPLNGVFEAEDGWVSISATDGETESALRQMIAETSVSETTSVGDSSTERLESDVSAWVEATTVDDIVRTCEQYGVTVSPVQDIHDVVSSEYLSDRDMFADVDCQDRTLSIPVSPYCTALDGQERPERGGPTLGEHTEEVLTEVLNYDRGEVATLLDDEIVHGDR